MKIAAAPQPFTAPDLRTHAALSFGEIGGREASAHLSHYACGQWTQATPGYLGYIEPIRSFSI